MLPPPTDEQSMEMRMQLMEENSALKDFTLLSEWDKNWKASLQRMNALDISLYEEAQLIAAQQLRAHGLSLERRTRGLAASMPAQV